jgi:hypothetical protein
MTDINLDRCPPPWGYLATLAWAVLAGIFSTLITAIAVIWWRPDVLSKSFDVLSDGRLLSITTCVWNVVQIGGLALVARLAHWPAGRYLGLIRPRGRDAVVALGALVLFLVGSDALTYLLGRDIVSPFQITSYLNARASQSLPLLWLAFTAVGPAGEEIMFRGFLYRGWVQSERGVLPGLVVISAVWTAMHIQYDWFGLVQVFLMGLLLGLVRWQSGSTTLTVLMHGFNNLWAMLETAAKAQWLS